MTYTYNSVYIYDIYNVYIIHITCTMYIHNIYIHTHDMQGTLRFKEEISHEANAGLEKVLPVLEPLKVHRVCMYVCMYVCL